MERQRQRITIWGDGAHSGGRGARRTILNMKFIFNIVLLLLPCFAVGQSEDSFFPHLRSDRFWLSGQANLVFQAQPGTASQYSGLQSFSSRYEKATSRVFTLYTATQISKSLEVVVDVEEAGGETLSRGFGLAAPANADWIDPAFGRRPYLSRLIVHKVIGLAKENEESERGPLSTFSELPAQRIDLRVGRFGASDFFDTNAAGSDTHLQFLNSALMQNAAYDYAADAKGYTWGASAELTTGGFSVRFAELLIPDAPGSDRLIWNLRRAHSENAELQIATKILPRRVTVIRLLAFRNHAPSRSYASPLSTGDKYGVGVNIEQYVKHGITAFLRVGWNDGATQSFCYDEVDNTAAAGVVVRGARWRRAFDRVGVGFASNGLSSAHARYLANDGTGMMLSDGHLSYGRENGVEAFYTVHVKRGVYLSPSLQWIVNPGMNADHGAAVIAGWRTHVEF